LTIIQLIQKMEQSRHGQGITSVKVHHPSGGASSFSLAHEGADDDRWGNSGKIGQSNRAARTVHHEEEKQPVTTDERREQAPTAGPGAFTSVKYSGNPPGGKSSITF
jgi:hypothetical protein